MEIFCGRGFSKIPGTYLEIGSTVTDSSLMVFLEPYDLWKSSFFYQKRTKYSPQGWRPLDDRHNTRHDRQDKTPLREATLSWWSNITNVPGLEKQQFSAHLIVADHLSLSLDPVPHCLDAKICFSLAFSSSYYQMLSNGGWIWEEIGSRALRAEGLWKVLRS